MRDRGSLQLKLQELCDCFATSDPLREMAALDKERDREVAALKWIALAALHGITAGAERITLAKDEEGNVEVNAKYRTSPLPSPGKDLGNQLVEAARKLMHMDEEKGNPPLALGIRDSSIQLEVKFKKEKGREECSIVFPE